MAASQHAGFDHTKCKEAPSPVHAFVLKSADDTLTQVSKRIKPLLVGAADPSEADHLKLLEPRAKALLHDVVKVPPFLDQVAQRCSSLGKDHSCFRGGASFSLPRQHVSAGAFTTLALSLSLGTFAVNTLQFGNDWVAHFPNWCSCRTINVNSKHLT